jgi:type IV pilus assembly protein PilZ
MSAASESVMTSRPQRYHVDIPIDCSTQGLFIANRVTNLSRGGLFIQSSHPLPLHAEVELAITLPNGGPRIQATGRVIWNYDVAKGSARIVPGSGIKFINMSPQDRALLEECIARLGQPNGASAAPPTHKQA